MSRSLLSAAAVRPIWGDGERRVEGPDEDAFTLAVAALERLVGGTPSAFPHGFDQVDLVGSFPTEVESLVPAALGQDDVEVRRHAGETASVAQAVRNAAHAAGDGAAVVVTVDLARDPAGPAGSADAIAVAAAFGPGKGAAFLGASARRHPPERRPDAAQWIAAARRSAPEASEATHGAIALAASAAPPVLLAEWRRAFPNVAAVHRPWSPPSAGGGPAGVLFVTLHEAARHAAASETVWSAAIRTDRTDFLAFRIDANVSWLGTFQPMPPGRPLPTRAGFEGVDLGAGRVSQGAYVPRATYLENLPARWRFAAQRCAACGATTFPPRDRCDQCGATDGLTPITLPTQGLEVEAATVVAPGAQPTEFDPMVGALGPYGVVLVRLAPGARATLQVTDTDPTTLAVGSRVDTVLRRIYATEGSWRYGRKAVGTAEAPAPTPRQP